MYVQECRPDSVSLNYTTHLHDASMVKCTLNAYHNNGDVLNGRD